MDSPRFDDPVLESMVKWYFEEEQAVIHERSVEIEGMKTVSRVQINIRYSVGVFSRHGEEILFYHKQPHTEIIPLGTDISIDDLITEPVH